MILYGALMLLDALLLWAIIARSKRWWGLKLLAIISTIALNFFTINAFGSGSGWPATSFPAKSALFLNCVVVEPDPATGASGAIYLIVVPNPTHPLIGYRSHDGSPKIFVTPYSRVLHEECLAANKQTQAGYQFMIGKAVGGGAGHAPGHYRFYHLPPPNQPRKVHP